MENLVRLLITGDLVITKKDYNSESIDPFLLKLFGDSDLNIMNLECPVTNASSENRINKTGPHLKGLKNEIAKVLKSLEVDVVTLANNHIMDYGEIGLIETLQFCKEEKVSAVGAGLNIQDSSKVYRTEIKGKKLSIINFSENEWASADEHKAGANPYDIVNNINQIRDEKIISDIIIVVIHGGHEYYNLPSPRMVKHYRHYAENGASVVVGHHTHSISGYENHKGVPIFYSLGNFLFTNRSPYDEWYVGLVLELTINQANKIGFNLIPIEQKRETYKLEVIKDEHKKKILASINEYSRIIKNKFRLEESWDRFLNERKTDYLSYYSHTSFIQNRYLKFVIKKLRLDYLFISKNSLKLHLNLLQCEAHSDLSKGVLRKFIKEK